MELLGRTNMRWAGYGLPDHIQYQYLETEYMKADEYSLFLDDPSDFVLRCYLPRINVSLKGLAKLPKFSVDGIGARRIYEAFRDPDVLEALDLLKQAAELSVTPRDVTVDTIDRLHAMGFPSFASGFAAAPFDVVGDSLRGTRGISTDMYRCPDQLLAACEKVLALSSVPDVPLGASPLVTATPLTC